METNRGHANGKTTAESNQIVTSRNLYITPAMEPVAYSSYYGQRKHDLEEYLHNIGEEEHLKEILPDLLHKPPELYNRSNYTVEQKKWIKQKRDEGKNQAPYPNIQKANSLIGQKDIEALELHHIVAQGFAQAWLGLANHQKLIHHPHNGITLSRVAHRGPYIPNVNHSIHPDVDYAMKRFGEGTEQIRRIFENHWNMALDGIKYWNSDHDNDMFHIARERTERMRRLQAERSKNGKG